MKAKSKLLWRTTGPSSISGATARLRSDPQRKGFWLYYHVAHRSRGYQARISFGGDDTHRLFDADFSAVHARAKAWCEENVERLLNEKNERFHREATANRWVLDASAHVNRVGSEVSSLSDELVLVALGEVDALPPDTRAIALALLAQLQEQKDVVARSREQGDEDRALDLGLLAVEDRRAVEHFVGVVVEDEVDELAARRARGCVIAAVPTKSVDMGEAVQHVEGAGWSGVEVKWVC